MIEIKGRRTVPAGESLRILHTSDWHLGRDLADVDRTEDYAQMLSWLLSVIRERRIDALLVAGDVFDTPMPPSSAQKLYFDFLAEAARTDLIGVVVAAGNHDSQRFLSAPRGLLSVVRCAVSTERAEDEAVVLRDASGRALLGVAAVPYLREGDVRMTNADMDEADRARFWEAGVAERYAGVQERLRMALKGEAAPLIAMGHLFVTGARPSARLLKQGAGDPSHYVGSLRNVGAEAFGAGWRYAALGHIHEAQAVKAPDAGYEIRYSGSPLMLDFTHERYRHQVEIVEVPADGAVSIEILDVPQPRLVRTLRGGLDKLLAGIAEAGRQCPGAIVSCVADCGSSVAERRIASAALEEAARTAGVHLGPVVTAAQARARDDEPPLKRLDDITPLEVFEDVLGAAGDMAPEKRAKLEALFAEAEASARDAMAAEQAVSEARLGTGGLQRAAAPAGRKADVCRE